jgi:dsRNA-specific ribonuclease
MSLPPLPSVQSDATLAIFVHSSLKSEVLNERFGDGDRLAFLGQRVLQMVVSEILFEKRPMHDIMELEVCALGMPCAAVSHRWQLVTDRAR